MCALGSVPCRLILAGKGTSQMETESWRPVAQPLWPGFWEGPLPNNRTLLGRAAGQCGTARPGAEQHRQQRGRDRSQGTTSIREKENDKRAMNKIS